MAEGWNLDRAVHDWSQSLRTPWLDEVLGSLTHLGDNPILLVVALVACVELWRRGRLPAAVVLVTAAVLGMVLVEVAKELVQRPRPVFLTGPFDPARPTFAYPSGHSFNSAAVYLLAALLIRERTLLGAAVAVAVLVGLTRLYLGVHWLSDVLGGWAGGAGWALVWAWLADRPGRLLGAPGRTRQAPAPGPGPPGDNVSPFRLTPLPGGA